MKSSIRRIINLSLLFLNFFNLLSQDLPKKDFIRKVQTADVAFYYDEDFEKAATLYKSLTDIYPGNVNLKAKLGICYLNIDGKQKDALNLLTVASSNIVRSEIEYTEYGEKAPLDTYLYLAIAYHRNDSLEKALSLYIDAKKRLSGTQLFRDDYIDNQIRDCKYAMEMKNKPLTIINRLFVPWLSEYEGACNPVISKNDSVFIFTQKISGQTKIFCSYKSGTWQQPIDITGQLGKSDKFFSNSISGDGKLLIIYVDDGGDGNLYYSIRKGASWSKIKNFGKQVNTIYWEAHGSVTPDGKTLYIASNRPGGAGELDIWVSEKSDKGSWSTPVNCGNTINTPYNENYPSFDPETSTLLFSSVGHISMGGYDVFRSIKRNGKWTNPVGLPYSYNTTGEDVFYILNNSDQGFVASLYNNSTGIRNIFSLVAQDPSDKITQIQGRISLKDGMHINQDKIKIYLTDLSLSNSGTHINLIDTNSFIFKIKPGDYQIFISHEGYKTDTINLNLPLYYPSNFISVESALIPDKVSKGEFLSINNLLFAFNDFSLDDSAKHILENLIYLLNSYPDLKIEVAGYTDAIGSTGYNLNLAGLRSQTVIDYIISSGISPERLIKKAYGKSNFIAVNTNIDGSDNPEGRKYNRRVTFGVVDPKTGVTISQETYTPEHLRQPYSIKYSIVLKKTKTNLPENSFDSLLVTEKLFIRKLEIESLSLYTIGLFYNKSDAAKYLMYAQGKGFPDAYIVNQYEINNASVSLFNNNPDLRLLENKTIFTIQLLATKKPVKRNTFKNTEGISEIIAKDGFHRYIIGEYNSYTEAEKDLIELKRSGFEDAFIRDLNLLKVMEAQ